MSRGVFTILESLNGKQDVLLTARDVLAKRLQTQLKKNITESHFDPRPTIFDTQQTHDFIPVGIYRPHVSVATEYIKIGKKVSSITKLFQSSANDNTITFDLQANNGHYVHDMVIHVVIQPLQATSEISKYRYCALPGARLFNKVSLIVDSNIIDDYSTEDFIQDIFIGTSQDKLRSLQEMLGQEIIENGSWTHETLNIKQIYGFTSGPQTKQVQPRLELWIPLRFWFNIEIGQSMWNHLLTTFEKRIEVAINPITKIIKAYDSNDSEVSLSSVDITSIDLYSKNIYVNPEILDLVVKRKAINLIRVHKSQVKELTAVQSDICLSQLKYPIEAIYFGFRPNENDTFDNWYKFMKQTTTSFPIPVVIPGTPPQLVVRTAEFTTQTPCVSKLGLSLNGNIVYQQIAAAFYRLYTPYTAQNVSTVYNCGTHLINFALLAAPGTRPLSGHINNTTGKELYINYTESTINFNNPCTFYVTAKCINMLYFKGDGSMILKYIT